MMLAAFAQAGEAIFGPAGPAAKRRREDAEATFMLLMPPMA